MINGEELKELIANPEKRFLAERKALSDRIEAQRLGTEEVKDAVMDTAKAKAKDVALDVLNGKWGDLIFDVMDTGDHFKSKLDDMKRAMLLAEYVQKVDDQESGLSKLIDLITNPYGLSIYSKILSLLSDAPADDEMLDLLSGYLVNLANEDDLSSVFSQTKSILTLIDKCSPQALFLLKNSESWPSVKPLKSVVIIGNKVRGDNTRTVAEAFSKVPKFCDIQITAIEMALTDLHSNGLSILVPIHSNIADGDWEKETIVERLTEIGKLVKKSISKSIIV